MISLALLIALADETSDKTKRFDQIVEVDGVRLHVETEGRNVTIAPRKPFGKQTIEAKERARKAVTMVTGCRLTDEYWANPYFNTVAGALDCSGRASQ